MDVAAGIVAQYRSLDASYLIRPGSGARRGGGGGGDQKENTPAPPLIKATRDMLTHEYVLPPFLPSLLESD